MADAGIAARRVCEEMILAGRVTVNDQVISKLPSFVDPRTDDIRVDGSRVGKPERAIYIMLNKPERTLVVSSDEPGADRRTVMDLIDHPSAGRLFPVGRLDYDTTGLVILTNDGSLANRLTHPRYGVVKTYQAIVRGIVSQDHLEAIRKKLGSERRREARESATASAKAEAFGTQQESITVVQSDASRTLLQISLTEAKNRQIREVLAMLGCPVKKLVRVALGPLVLKGIPSGGWRELTRGEVSLLREAGSARSGARKAPPQSPKNRTMKKDVPRRAGTKPNVRPADDTGESEINDDLLQDQLEGGTDQFNTDQLNQEFDMQDDVIRPEDLVDDFRVPPPKANRRSPESGRDAAGVSTPGFGPSRGRPSRNSAPREDSRSRRRGGSKLDATRLVRPDEVSSPNFKAKAPGNQSTRPERPAKPGSDRFSPSDQKSSRGSRKQTSASSQRPEPTKGQNPRANQKAPSKVPSRSTPIASPKPLAPAKPSSRPAPPAPAGANRPKGPRVIRP